MMMIKLKKGRKVKRYIQTRPSHRHASAIRRPLGTQARQSDTSYQRNTGRIDKKWTESLRTRNARSVVEWIGLEQPRVRVARRLDAHVNGVRHTFECVADPCDHWIHAKQLPLIDDSRLAFLFARAPVRTS